MPAMAGSQVVVWSAVVLLGNSVTVRVTTLSQPPEVIYVLVKMPALAASQVVAVSKVGAKGAKLTVRVITLSQPN